MRINRLSEALAPEDGEASPHGWWRDSRVFLTGLRVRLFLMVLLGILPCIGLMVYSLMQHRRMAVTRAGEESIRHANLIADAEFHVLSDARTLLVALSHADDVTDGDPTQCSIYLVELLRHFPEYVAVGVVDVDGLIVCNSSPQSGLVEVSGQGWFHEALRSREFSVGQYEDGRLKGGPILHLGYPVILPGADRPTGVSFAELDLAAFARHIGANANEDASRRTVSIIDRNGVLIARQPPTPVWVGRPLPNREALNALLAGEQLVDGIGGDGIRRMHALAAIGPHDNPYLYVIVSMSVDTVVSEIDRSFYTSLTVLAAVATIVLLAARAFANAMILRPLQTLTAAAERVSAGELTYRAPVRGGVELRQLASTFNTMAERLAEMIRTEQESKQSLAEEVECLVTQRTHDAESLSRLSELLQACLSLDEAYGVIRRLATHCVGELPGAIFVISESNTYAEARAAWGMFIEGSSAIFHPENCWALRRGRQHRAKSGGFVPVCGHVPAGVTSGYVCIPLVAHGETLGIFHLIDDGSDERSDYRAGTFADHIALALANLRLRDALRNQSIRDSLTGLFNRRFLEEALDREIRRAERQHQSLGVLMLDIDHFKQFNDSFGHDGGDALLREFGRLLLQHIRGADVACRYGGEEFTLLIPDCSAEVILERSEEIRRAVQLLKVTHQNHDLGYVTISIGVAVFPTHELSAHGLLRAADGALYRAKRQGRNQVQLASSGTVETVQNRDEPDAPLALPIPNGVAGAAQHAS